MKLIYELSIFILFVAALLGFLSVGYYYGNKSNKLPITSTSNTITLHFNSGGQSILIVSLNPSYYNSSINLPKPHLINMWANWTQYTINLSQMPNGAYEIIDRSTSQTAQFQIDNKTSTP